MIASANNSYEAFADVTPPLDKLDYLSQLIAESYIGFHSLVSVWTNFMLAGTTNWPEEMAPFFWWASVHESKTIGYLLYHAIASLTG